MEHAIRAFAVVGIVFVIIALAAAIVTCFVLDAKDRESNKKEKA